MPCNENGISQSPINVITQKTKRAVFKPFRNVGKVRRLREVTMLNNGHTVKVLPNEETSRAVITSGPMQADLYKFVEMHFHWGSNDSRGAEHQINNQVYGALFNVFSVFSVVGRQYCSFIFFNLGYDFFYKESICFFSADSHWRCI